MAAGFRITLPGIRMQYQVLETWYDREGCDWAFLLWNPETGEVRSHYGTNGIRYVCS